MTAPPTSAQFFDSLPAAFKADPERFKLNTLLHITVTGIGGGRWTLFFPSLGDLKPPSCELDLHGIPKATIEISNEDFLGFLEKPCTALRLFVQGKLRITGSEGDVLKLKVLAQALFP